MKVTVIGAAGCLGSCTTFDIAVHGLADEITEETPCQEIPSRFDGIILLEKGRRPSGEEKADEKKQEPAERADEIENNFRPGARI